MNKIYVYYGEYWKKIFNYFHILWYLLLIVFLDGFMRILGETLQRPLHWFACTFRASELPLRHLLAKIYGKTVGPRGFHDQLVIYLLFVKIEPTVNFNMVIEPSDLGREQMYSYKTWCLVSSGVMSESFAKRHPGNTCMSHAR